MLNIAPRAQHKLGEELTQKCLDAGIGFRLLANVDKEGKFHPNLRFDRKRPADVVLDAVGVKVFVGAEDAELLRDFCLEYIENPDGGWFLVMKKGGA